VDQPFCCRPSDRGNTLLGRSFQSDEYSGCDRGFNASTDRDIHNNGNTHAGYYFHCHLYAHTRLDHDFHADANRDSGRSDRDNDNNGLCNADKDADNEPDFDVYPHAC
jgi:hypothetical protein